MSVSAIPSYSQALKPTRAYFHQNPLKEVVIQENPGRWVLFPIEFPSLWDMYKQIEQGIWTAEDFNYDEDVDTLRSLSCAPELSPNFVSTEKPKLETKSSEAFQLLARLSAALLALTGVPNKKGQCSKHMIDALDITCGFLAAVQAPEGRAFLGFQMAAENIQRESYGLWLKAFGGPSKEEWVGLIDTVESSESFSDLCGFLQFHLKGLIRPTVERDAEGDKLLAATANPSVDAASREENLSPNFNVETGDETSAEACDDDGVFPEWLISMGLLQLTIGTVCGLMADYFDERVGGPFFKCVNDIISGETATSSETEDSRRYLKGFCGCARKVVENCSRHASFVALLYTTLQTKLDVDCVIEITTDWLRLTYKFLRQNVFRESPLLALSDGNLGGVLTELGIKTAKAFDIDNLDSRKFEPAFLGSVGLTPPEWLTSQPDIRHKGTTLPLYTPGGRSRGPGDSLFDENKVVPKGAKRSLDLAELCHQSPDRKKAGSLDRNGSLDQGISEEF